MSVAHTARQVRGYWTEAVEDRVADTYRVSTRLVRDQLANHHVLAHWTELPPHALNDHPTIVVHPPLAFPRTVHQGSLHANVCLVRSKRSKNF